MATKSFDASLDDLLSGLDLPSNDDLKREMKGKKITESKLSITPEKANEIWMKLWGEDRGSDLYKKLAKEYNVAYSAVFGLALGNHPLSPVDKDQWKLIYQEWHNRYGYNKNIYVVRSPGNDLLDYYDEMNSKRGPVKTSKIPPSVIYDIRFNKEASKEEVKKYLKENNIKVDNTMIATYASKTFGWLVDAPHQEWEFDSLVEMSKWLFERGGRKCKKGGQLAEDYLSRGMLWMDKGGGLSGWSFVKKSK